MQIIRFPCIESLKIGSTNKPKHQLLCQSRLQIGDKFLFKMMIAAPLGEVVSVEISRSVLIALGS